MMLNKLIRFSSRLSSSDFDCLVAHTTGWLQETLYILRSKDYDHASVDFADVQILPIGVQPLPLSFRLFHGVVACFLGLSLCFLLKKTWHLIVGCKWRNVEETYYGLISLAFFFVLPGAGVCTLAFSHLQGLVEANQEAFAVFKEATASFDGEGLLSELFESEYKELFRWEDTLFYKMLQLTLLGLTVLLTLSTLIYFLFFARKKEDKIQEESVKKSISFSGTLEGDKMVLNPEDMIGYGATFEKDEDAGTITMTLANSLRQIRAAVASSLPSTVRELPRKKQSYTSTPFTQKRKHYTLN